MTWLRGATEPSSYCCYPILLASLVTVQDARLPLNVCQTLFSLDTVACMLTFFLFFCRSVLGRCAWIKRADPLSSMARFSSDIFPVGYYRSWFLFSSRLGASLLAHKIFILFWIGIFISSQVPSPRLNVQGTVLLTITFPCAGWKWTGLYLGVIPSGTGMETSLSRTFLVSKLSTAPLPHASFFDQLIASHVSYLRA